jgi:hypothetical protein
VEDLALGAVELGDGASPGGRDFDEGLVGFHFGEDVVLVDGLADGHTPLDQLGFVDAFAEVGEDEDIGIRGLLVGHRGKLRGEAG